MSDTTVLFHQNEHKIWARRKATLIFMCIVWLLACLVYIWSTAEGDNPFAVMPSELAIIVLLAVTPVGMCWLGLAVWRANSQLAAITYRLGELHNQFDLSSSTATEQVNEFDVDRIEKKIEDVAASSQRKIEKGLNAKLTALRNSTKQHAATLADIENTLHEHQDANEERNAALNAAIVQISNVLSEVKKTVEQNLIGARAEASENDVILREPEPEAAEEAKVKTAPKAEPEDKPEEAVARVDAKSDIEAKPNPPAVVGEEAVITSATPAPFVSAEFSVIGQMVPKPNNDTYLHGEQNLERRSEDRYRISDIPNGVLAAVADGAGSSGMFCGAWADTLVTRLPDAPFTGFDDLNSWVEGFWEEFSISQKQRAKDNPQQMKKFIQEGSCATLVSCWAQKKNKNTTTLHWIGYGDSPFYVFQHKGKTSELIASFPSTLAHFDRDPHLLNWKDLPDQSHLQRGTMDIKGSATVVLASDGIGQSILLNYLADVHANSANAKHAPLVAALLQEYRTMVKSGKSKLAEMAREHASKKTTNFAMDLAELRVSLKSEDAFMGMMSNHHKHKLIPNDDSTVVLVDV